MKTAKEILRILFRQYLTSIATLIIITAVLCAIGANIFAPFAQGKMHLDDSLLPPLSQNFFFGTADNGLDILSEIIYGSRVSLLVGILVTFISSVAGIIIGLISGYSSSWLDMIIMRMIDILLAFPGILLAIGFTGIFGPSLFNLVFALSLTSWISYARIVRSQTLKLKQMDFIVAAHSIGATPLRIIMHHIFPNLLGPLLVQITFGLASAILSEAALSFLGLGVPTGTASWGSMLDEGCYYILVAPHLAIFPGICIALLVLSFNIIGDELRDYFDPKQQQL